VKVALDSNILVYGEGANGMSMKTATLKVLGELRQTNSLIAPVQALGELFAVLRRKAGYSPAQARRAILDWRNVATVIDTTDSILLAAADLAQNQFSIWDAVIVCAAAEAGCQLLLSEDMQDGFAWQRVTIANPFAKTLHPLLRSVLDSKP
jgi:predicted nucleic acid-binding protein